MVPVGGLKTYSIVLADVMAMVREGLACSGRSNLGAGW
jgi:hypothetical protein